MKDSQENAAPINYSKCGMSKGMHILVFLGFYIAGTVLLGVFYPSYVYSAVVAVPVAYMLEKEYARSTIKKRKKKLRMQFCDMLEAMSVASRAGNNELKALESAYKDLTMTYSEKADIVREVGMIIEKNRSNIPLRVLFKDFGERSGVEDIRSFGAIYEVIEGKSNKFADIIKQTQQIIADKIDIEEEIETVLTAPKTENKIMLVMPVLIVMMMSSGDDGGMLAPMFASALGPIVSTACIALFVGAYLLGQKITDIEV